MPCGSANRPISLHATAPARLAGEVAVVAGRQRQRRRARTPRRTRRRSTRSAHAEPEVAEHPAIERPRVAERPQPIADLVRERRRARRRRRCRRARSRRRAASVSRRRTGRVSPSPSVRSTSGRSSQPTPSVARPALDRRAAVEAELGPARRRARRDRPRSRSGVSRGVSARRVPAASASAAEPPPPPRAHPMIREPSS